MAITEIVLDPVDEITIDSLGPPGNRVFYIEGRKGGQVVSLIIEKFQVQSLIAGVAEFLKRLIDKFPEQGDFEAPFSEEGMHIEPPVDVRFRVGEIELSYDAERDRVIIIAHELLTDGDQQDSMVVRYGCTRAQLLSLARWSAMVVERGRPICPQCQQPMEPEGHFCPKKNGHKKSEPE